MIDWRNIKEKYLDSFVIALCLLFLGMLIILQFKTAKLQTSSIPSSFVNEINELTLRLEDEITRGKKLIDENAKLNQEYNKYINDYVREIKDSDLGSKLDLVNRYKLLAGLTNVEGEGITITMRDAKVKQDLDPSLFLIHDMDIIRVFNELKIAGAQAIAINGERVLTVSEIMCAGPTVRINRNRYPVPYVINAIGNTDTLSSTLENSLIFQLLKDYDISIKIEKKSKLLIRKYLESFDWTINTLTEVIE